MIGREPSRRSKVVSVWRDTPDWLRTTTGVSIGVAFALFVLGVTADALNWAPSEWNYFVNLYSSITAFFVAVPIALIGLDAVAETRRTEAERSKIDKQTVRAWGEFDTAVREYCAPQVMRVLSEFILPIFNPYSQLKSDIKRYVQEQPMHNAGPHRGYFQGPEAGHDPEGYAALRQQMQEVRALVAQGLEDIRYMLPMDRDVQLRWSRVKSTWRIFSVEITAKRDDLGLGALNHQVTAIFDDRTAIERHPLYSLYNCFPRTVTSPLRPDSLGDIPPFLDHLLFLSEQAFLDLIGSSSLNPFSSTTDGSDRFLEIGVNGLIHLRELLSTVEHVDIHQVISAA